MPNVESILLEIKKLPTIEQENILSILEEVLLFGYHVGRISQEVMESRFSKGKVCPHCGEDSISRNGKYNANSDIFANHAGKVSLTSLIQRYIRVGPRWRSGTSMRSA